MSHAFKRTPWLKSTRLPERDLDADVSLPAECTECNTELPHCTEWCFEDAFNLKLELENSSVRHLYLCHKAWRVALTLESGSTPPLGLKRKQTQAASSI